MSIMPMPFNTFSETNRIKEGSIHHQYFNGWGKRIRRRVTWKCAVCGKATIAYSQASLLGGIWDFPYSRINGRFSLSGLDYGVGNFTSLCASCLDESLRELCVRGDDLVGEPGRVNAALDEHDDEHMAMREKPGKDLVTTYIPVMFSRVFLNMKKVDMKGSVELDVIEIKAKRQGDLVLRWNAACAGIPALRDMQPLPEIRDRSINPFIL